jgi:hypothetical protein
MELGNAVAIGIQDVRHPLTGVAPAAGSRDREQSDQYANDYQSKSTKLLQT